VSYKISVHLNLAGTEFSVGQVAFEDHSPSLAFRYDEEWLKIGFSLGSDLPLLKETKVLRPIAENSPRLFSFLKDHECGRWVEDLQNLLSPNREAISTFENRFNRPHQTYRFSSIGFGEKKIDDFVPLRLDRQNLRHLMRATENFYRARLTAEEARLLYDASTDFGGEKIKFLVFDEKGEEKIFRPRPPLSRIDEPLWMALTQNLAKNMGLQTVSGELLPGLGYLEGRFDREGTVKRFCLSAATLVQKRSFNFPATWLDLADILNREGSRPTIDLAELFRRLVFDVLTANARSTLNRIWFYREDGGWRLAPLSSPLPSPPVFRVRELSIPIARNNLHADPENAISVASYFGLTERRARDFLLNAQQQLANWKTMARDYGALSSEVALMNSAFFA